MLYVNEQRDDKCKKMKHECIFPRDWYLCTEMVYLITSLHGKKVDSTVHNAAATQIFIQDPHEVSKYNFQIPDVCLISSN